MPPLSRFCETWVPEMILHYDPRVRARWRKRDPSVVPPEALQWKGHGVGGSYGFAELFVSEPSLRSQGYDPIALAYNLAFRKTSKYARNNQRIEAALGVGSYLALRRLFQTQKKAGFRVQQPDIVVLGPGTPFFVECKMDADTFGQNSRTSPSLFRLFSGYSSSCVGSCRWGPQGNPDHTDVRVRFL